MSLHVIKAGFATTIQDLGRFGFQSNGVPIGGAMDEYALMRANLLVGNNRGEACIEFLMGQSEVMFEEDTLIALAGSGSKAIIDEHEIPFHRAIKVKAGTTLKFKYSTFGMWKYLAVGGGFQLTKTLGSYSTYPTGGFGGLNGTWLNEKDRLLIKTSKSSLTKAIATSLSIGERKLSVAKWGVPFNKEDDSTPIRIIAGREWDWLTDESKTRLRNGPFSISNDSNRMGYRLEGNYLDKIINHELISTAVTKGTMQLTNQGQPVVLMADAQTVGGYPRVAQVISVDISRLAQKRVAEIVTFKMISWDEAESLFLVKEREMDEIEVSIRRRFS